MPRWLNLPTCLTLLRLALTPVIVVSIVDGRHMFALAVFAFAAFTDILDGAAARTLKMTTRTGAYLDPIADKCLLSGVFLALAVARIVPRWLVAIVFGRDLLILLGVGIVLFLTPERRFPPSVWGKLSTFVQILTAVAWMAQNALQFPVLGSLAYIMLWPCVGLTVWSGLDYTRRGIRVARAH
jgi:cardiolipin synthase (CMP-forming)